MQKRTFLVHLYARMKQDWLFGCFQLRLLLFWGVNDVCLRSPPPAYKHPTVCRMGLPAHGLAFEPLPVCKLRCFAHGQLAFVPLPVSRMRHSAHGTRDQSPHRDTSTAPKTCLGMGMISSYVCSCVSIRRNAYCSGERSSLLLQKSRSYDDTRRNRCNRQGMRGAAH